LIRLPARSKIGAAPYSHLPLSSVVEAIGNQVVYRSGEVRGVYDLQEEMPFLYLGRREGRDPRSIPRIKRRVPGLFYHRPPPGKSLESLSLIQLRRVFPHQGRSGTIISLLPVVRILSSWHMVLSLVSGEGERGPHGMCPQTCHLGLSTPSSAEFTSLPASRGALRAVLCDLRGGI